MLKVIKIFFTRLLFKHKLNNGKLIKVNDNHRGIGKTAIMVDFAIKNDLAIVVGNQDVAYNLIKINPDLKIIRLAHNFTMEIKGSSQNYPNGVLIDDSLHPELISLLRINGFRIRGGFIYSN